MHFQLPVYFVRKVSVSVREQFRQFFIRKSMFLYSYRKSRQITVTLTVFLSAIEPYNSFNIRFFNDAFIELKFNLIEEKLLSIFLIKHKVLFRFSSEPSLIGDCQLFSQNSDSSVCFVYLFGHFIQL